MIFDPKLKQKGVAYIRVFTVTLTIIVIYVVGSLFKDVVHVFVVFFSMILHMIYITQILPYCKC